MFFYNTLLQFLPALQASTNLDDVTLKLALTSHRTYENSPWDNHQPPTHNNLFFQAAMFALPPSIMFVQVDVRLTQAIAMRREAAIKDVNWAAIAKKFSQSCPNLQSISITLKCDIGTVKNYSWTNALREHVSQMFADQFETQGLHHISWHATKVDSTNSQETICSPWSSSAGGRIWLA